MIKQIVVWYLIINLIASVVNTKYANELKWPSAVMVAVTAPFYTVTWLCSPWLAEKVFTPLYSYENPHHVSTGRALVHRQPDGKWQ